jgi:ankyrin repeat protein
MLLEKGADPNVGNVWGLPLLFRAVCDGYEMFVEMLLERGANTEVIAYGRTPLSWASMIGNGAIVKMLVENGANIEARDSQGRTSVWWAANGRHRAIVEMLCITLRSR